MAVTRITDLIVPEIFSPYVMTLTTEKSRLIQSGAVAQSSVLSSLLAGGGITFNAPSFKDLANDAENISTDDPAVFSTPYKIETLQEIQVRMNRNQSWSSMDLAGELAGADPMAAIASRVAAYWTRRLQAMFIAAVTGVLADNAAAATGTDTHTLDDLTHDVSGGGFVDGVTNFSAEAFIDTTSTMGDSMDELGMIMVHSIVYARMKKNNLIDFVADATNPNAMSVPTFLGHTVIVDDAVPRSSGVFENWLFRAGALQFGSSAPPVPTEVDRIPGAGTGSGQDVLHNRVQWCIHPVGHAYIATPANGGPSNATTSTNLGHLDSWSRVFPERNQIGIARLITREF